MSLVECAHAPHDCGNRSGIRGAATSSPRETTEADGFFDTRTGDLFHIKARAHWASRLRIVAHPAARRAMRLTDAVGRDHTEHAEIFPTVDRDGVVYSASDRDGIDLSPSAKGIAVSLGAVVNTPKSDSNTLVLPE